MIWEVFSPYGILLACMFWRWCSHFVWCRFLQSLHLRNHSGRVVNTSNGWAKWPQHPSHKEHPSPAWVWPCVAQKAWNISHHISKLGCVMLRSNLVMADMRASDWWYAHTQHGTSSAQKGKKYEARPEADGVSLSLSSRWCVCVIHSLIHLQSCI